MVMILNSINSVSLIIPLTRPTAYLENILKLESNILENVEFIFVIDNPKKDFIDWVQNLVDKSGRKNTIVINEMNLGAPKSRNKGLENAKGDLILFLDDDVIPEKNLIDYHIQELENCNSFGVIGFTEMTFSKENRLQYAVGKAGFDYSFRLYTDYKRHSWGPTCNISFIREQIGNVRFKECYPKSGGGEDVDFFWFIQKINDNQKMIVSEKAKAIHPPWEGAKSIFKRIKRWGYADAILFNNQPERKYLDWPTYPGMNLLLILTTILLGSIIHPWFFIQIPIHLIISFILTGIFQMFDCKSDFITGLIIQSLRIWHHVGRLQRTINKLKFHQLLFRTQYFDNHPPKSIRRKTFTEFLLIIITYIISIVLLVYFLYMR